MPSNLSISNGVCYNSPVVVPIGDRLPPAVMLGWAPLEDALSALSDVCGEWKS